jgi:hypothetical protein
MDMALTQKIILIALLVVGGLFLIVGITLTHHIGGFLRTVEEEKERESEEDAKPRAPSKDSEADTND